MVDLFLDPVSLHESSFTKGVCWSARACQGQQRKGQMKNSVIFYLSVVIDILLFEASSLDTGSFVNALWQFFAKLWSGVRSQL